MFLRSNMSVVLPVLLVLGCSTEPSNPSQELLAFNGAEYIVLRGEGLNSGEKELVGTGTLLFKTPLGGIESQHNFALSFELDSGGSLSLLSHSANDGSGAFEVRLTRSEGKLEVALASNGKVIDHSEDFESIDVSRRMDLYIDVHNNEKPAHVLIWNEENYVESAALLNTADGHDHDEDHDEDEEEEEELSPGNGSGSYWGLSLSAAKVYQAVARENKFEE